MTLKALLINLETIRAGMSEETSWNERRNKITAKII